MYLDVGEGRRVGGEAQTATQQKLCKLGIFQWLTGCCCCCRFGSVRLSNSAWGSLVSGGGKRWQASGSADDLIKCWPKHAENVRYPVPLSNCSPGIVIFIISKSLFGSFFFCRPPKNGFETSINTNEGSTGTDIK